MRAPPVSFAPQALLEPTIATPSLLPPSRCAPALPGIATARVESQAILPVDRASARFAGALRASVCPPGPCEGLVRPNRPTLLIPALPFDERQTPGRRAL